MRLVFPTKNTLIDGSVRFWRRATGPQAKHPHEIPRGVGFAMRNCSPLGELSTAKRLPARRGRLISITIVVRSSASPDKAGALSSGFVFLFFFEQLARVQPERYGCVGLCNDADEEATIMSVPVGSPSILPAAKTTSIIRTVMLFGVWMTRCR